MNCEKHKGQNMAMCPICLLEVFSKTDDENLKLKKQLETAVDGLKWVANQHCTMDAEGASDDTNCSETSACITEWCYPCYCKQTLKTIQEESEKQDTRTPPQKAADLCQKIEQAQEVTKNSKQVFKKEESEGK